jgi:large subunit ribosomal protein L31
MQKELHPEYFPAAKVICACGNKFTVGSTKPEIHIEICSNCHPFYTGTEKILDAAGRVEKFKARRAAAAALPPKEKKVKVKKEASPEAPAKEADEAKPKVVKKAKKA